MFFGLLFFCKERVGFSSNQMLLFFVVFWGSFFVSSQNRHITPTHCNICARPHLIFGPTLFCSLFASVWRCLFRLFCLVQISSSLRLSGCFVCLLLNVFFPFSVFVDHLVHIRCRGQLHGLRFIKEFRTKNDFSGHIRFLQSSKSVSKGP